MRGRSTLGFLLILGSATGSASSQQPVRALRATETLHIAGSEHDLAKVPWVIWFASGRIAVGGEPADGTVRWFDAGGTPLGASGRRGEGPGEFKAPVAAGRIADSLWILDRATQRATLLFPGNLTSPGVSTLPLPQRIEAGDRLTVSVVGGVSALLPGRRMLFQGIDFTPGVGDPATAPQRLVVTDSLGRALASLPPGEAPGRCSVPYVAGGAKRSMGILFCPRPIVRLSQAGDRIAVVTSDNSKATQSTITVRVYGLDASLKYDVTIRVPARAIPPVVLDSMQRGALERARSPEERAARSRVRIPPAYPPVVDVVLSDKGAVWIGTSGATTTRTWIVLDPTGIRRADVSLPKDFRPVAVMGNDVLGTAVDPNDFIDIVRYRVGP